MSSDPPPRARAPWGVAVVAGMTGLALVGAQASADGPRRTGAHATGAAAHAVDIPGLGCGSAEVTRTLATGSAWRMCVRIDPFKGLVLEQVQFRPATGDREHPGWLPVVDSLYLAQLVVPYDTGEFTFNDVTSFGFGGAQLLAQNDQTCTGESMPVEQSTMLGDRLVERTIPGICLDEAETGLGWSSQEEGDPDETRYTQQGQALEVSSLTKISWYEYQQKVTLTDQGTITVGLGATGDLAPMGVFFPDDPATGWPIGSEGGEAAAGHASSHWHDAIYRVDFGIGSGAQQVERWDYARPDPARPTRVEGVGSIESEAFQAEADPDPQTWWRVVNPGSLNPDGHARSYEISNDAIQNPYDPLTRSKVSFTNDHPCQEYASENLNVGCPGLSVPDYVAAETEPLADPVAWVSVGFHHIDRDEDQSPMPVHWQQFSLIPRDLLAQQATTPVERSCVNGGPVELGGSCAAVNLVPPRITTGAATVDVGTILGSDRGTWRTARAPLTFQRQWLRDSVPIAGAVGVQYVVDAADRGHHLSVRVDAAAVGVTPGSAISAGLLVPAESTPAPSPSGTPSTTPDAAPTPPAGAPDRPATPTITLTQSRKGPPRLTIRVRGSAGRATGSVVVRGPSGWQRALTLASGRAVVPLPRAMAVRRARLVVRYRGDDDYRPAHRVIRLRRPVA